MMLVNTSNNTALQIVPSASEVAFCPDQLPIWVRLECAAGATFKYTVRHHLPFQIYQRGASLKYSQLLNLVLLTH